MADERFKAYLDLTKRGTQKHYNSGGTLERIEPSLSQTEELLLDWIAWESEQRQQDPIRAKRDTDDSMTSKTTVAANYYDPMLDPVARKKASPKKSMKLSQAMLYIIPDSTRDYRDTWVTVLVADLLLPDCNQDPTTLSQSLRFQIFRNKFSRLGNGNGSVWFQDRDSAAKEVTNVVVLGEALWRMQQMRDMGMQMRLG